jgi:uncharacterized protein YpmB
MSKQKTYIIIISVLFIIITSAFALTYKSEGQNYKAYRTALEKYNNKVKSIKLALDIT